MPDHLHLLVEGTADTSDAKRFFSLAKQYSGYAYSQVHKSRVWQRYGYEHVLRSDQLTEDVARYIADNPLRAGLVTSHDAYPFTGSAIYTREELSAWIYREGTARAHSG